MRRSRTAGTAGPGRQPVVLDARVKYFREQHLVSLRQTLMSNEEFRLLKLM